jgi:hypothetical protein
VVQIRTTVIEGSLAFQMLRAAAARANECGLQILSLLQLAARLAGGFTASVAKEHLDSAIRRALAEGGFVELENVRNLPGMTRAVSRTLRKVRDADVDLRAMGATGNVRVRELALIEERVRMHLPKTMLIPRDLRDAALNRIRHAARVVGPLTIDRLSYISPNWRPLIEALRKEVSVEWRAPGRAETEWFAGPVAEIDGTGYRSTPTAISCADPRHEVVESLRWARSLITSGSAKPHEIAIVAASPAPWDDHFHALSADAGIRLHFVHGIPALATRDTRRAAMRGTCGHPGARIESATRAEACIAMPRSRRTGR